MRCRCKAVSIEPVGEGMSIARTNTSIELRFVVIESRRAQSDISCQFDVPNELVKKMKALVMALALIGIAGGIYANGAAADETVKEKAQAMGNDAERGTKKAVNRMEEAACTEGNVKCAAKKAEHRMEEGADYTKDKAKEIKNDVDQDDKK
jgi:hypothetical protein